MMTKGGHFLFDFEHILQRLGNYLDENQDHPMLGFYMQSQNMQSQVSRPLLVVTGPPGATDKLHN